MSDELFNEKYTDFLLFKKEMEISYAGLQEKVEGMEHVLKNDIGEIKKELTKINSGLSNLEKESIERAIKEKMKGNFLKWFSSSWWKLLSIILSLGILILGIGELFVLFKPPVG